jgi:hypothetical protein
VELAGRLRLGPPSEAGRDEKRAWRLTHFACLVTTAILLGYAVVLTGDMLLHQPKWDGLITIGQDYRLYMRGVERFLATGSPYLPEQISGRGYDSFSGDVFLYPPLALLLMLPMYFLPAVLWWIVPIGVIAAMVWRLRPVWWSWPLLAACLAWPRTISYAGAGNTDMWIAAFAAAGVSMGWPAALVVLKPSFAPLMFVGVRRRSWWIACGLLVAFSLVTWPLTAQYITVIRTGTADVGYSLISLPVTLIGPIAWLGRRRDPGTAAVAKPRPSLEARQEH